VLDLINGETGELLPDSHIASAQWLPTGSDDAILFTNVTSETGETNIWILPKFGAQNEYKVGTIDGAVDNLKIRKFDDKLRFIFSALSNLDGSLYNEKKAEKPHATGRVYESLFVRHWDTYIRREKSTLFAGSISFKNNNYKLDPELKNLMRAGPADLETPIPPFGGGGDFDFSPDGKLVTFVSKTPGLNPANNTQTLVFLISFESNHPPLPLNTPGEELKNTEGKQFVFPCGASSSPKFSPDSKYVAYLQMKQNGYESDQNKIYLARADTSKEQDIILITSSWDLSPQSITWDSDGKSIYTTADNIGRHKLFKVFVKSGKVETVFQEHTVHDVDVIADGKLLLRISSLTFSPRSFILDTKSSRVTNLHQLIENEEIQSQIKVEDFWFPGANDTKVHGFIVKPSYFGKESITKYKFALFIHGGPQGYVNCCNPCLNITTDSMNSAWNDGWSTRWNPAVFAEYGYIVVAVNPTGSTGYGQKFVDDIQGQWGNF
jgi:dipeptidyl aminopeptidase/acylaminoacyl peptidase